MKQGFFCRRSGSPRRRRSLVTVVSLALLAVSPVSAFPHVAGPGETLASLAERFYGRIQMERVLSVANSLDGTTTTGLTPGMVLEIPAVTYRQVHQGETWKSLALTLLGDEARYLHLAEVNGHKPWIEPELGQLVVAPYNLSWIATGDESLPTLAYRFLGSTKHAYQLITYNDLGDRQLKRGEVLLIPLSELPLTEEGRAEAETAAAQITKQSHGDLFGKQRASNEDTKQLALDVRGGLYVSAVTRGTRLLSAGKLSEATRAQVHLLLLEAYVALDARGLARTECEAFRSLAPRRRLDPLTTSPKILRVCPGEPMPEAAPDKPATDEPAPDSNAP